MKLQVGKYLSLASLMATVAWFFWNPAGWTFQWEPIVVFLASLGAFVAFDWKDHQKPTAPDSPASHPSDVQLFKKLVELLPSVGPIEFLKQHDFLGPFDRSEIKPVMAFVHEWNNTEHEFVNAELEAMRNELYAAARTFCNVVAKYTSPTASGFQAVRNDLHGDGYDEEREGRYKKEAAEINAAADLVAEKHQGLVKLARERLR